MCSRGDRWVQETHSVGGEVVALTKRQGAELEVGDLNMQRFSLSVTRNEHIL